MLEKASGRWLGRAGPWIPEGAIGTEIGWALHPTAQGQGYAVEAAREAMRWAFATLGWREVIHCIDLPNLRSIAVAERLGSRLLRRDGETLIYGQSRAR